jgi:hypothetical protein
MQTVNQLLAEGAMASKHLSNANTEDMLNKCSFYFYSNFESYDGEITVIAHLSFSVICQVQI